MQTRGNHPVRLRRWVQTQCNYPSVSILDIPPPEEGNCRVQIRGNHPVRLRRWVQTQCNYPSVSILDIPPPQEGNCRVQIRGNHPVRLRLPPLHRRGIAGCRHEATTPSGCACHPSTGGELFAPTTQSAVLFCIHPPKCYTCDGLI